MPHYEISVIGGEVVCRYFNAVLRVFRLRDGNFYRYYAGPSYKDLSDRALKELSQEPALWAYQMYNDDPKQGLVGADLVPINLDIENILFLEDKVLGIIYLSDDRFLESIVRHVRARQELIRFIPPS